MSELEDLKARAKERDEARRTRVSELGLKGLDALAQEDRADLDRAIAIASYWIGRHEYDPCVDEDHHDLEGQRDQARADVLKLRDAFIPITTRHHHGPEKCRFCKVVADTEHYEQYREKP